MEQNRRRKAPPPSDTPGGNVTDFGAAARRRRARRARRLAALVVALTVLLVWLTGRYSASLVAISDLVESAQIALSPGPGFPVQTGLTELYQTESLSGGFVALGAEGCLVYAESGARLRNIQAGYARPTIAAAGGSRFALYNRGGAELRVEGRTRTLYTQNYEQGILLCAMAQNGSLAVATEDASYTAQLLVYPPTMEDPLTWKLTSAEGTPLRMAFSPNSQKLAVATLSAQQGQSITRLYVVDRARQSQTALAQRLGSVPLAVQWQSGDTLLVVYDDAAVLYNAASGEQTAEYSYGGWAPVAWSAAENGSLALLLGTDTSQQLVLLDSALALLAQTGVTPATAVTLTRTAAYTCTDTGVECYTLAGEYQWKKTGAAQPQAVLQTDRLLLAFAGGRAEECIAPETA